MIALIFSIYFPFPSCLQFYHCVGDVGVKNDISFVIHCFENVVLPLMWRYERVIIFSDGGPKHFKVSSLLYYFYSLQKLYPRFHFSYHFFASYHGHSVCDAAASQFKRSIIRQVNEQSSTPKTASELVANCDVRYHHGLHVVPEDNGIIYIKTLKGIRSFHYFQFTDDYIVASPLSTTTTQGEVTAMIPKIDTKKSK